MMLNEQRVLETLSKSEVAVYDYLKEESSKRGGSVKESMKYIGEILQTSEATVHRAIRKLRKQGIIGIVPSMEKAESNEIIFYGIPDEKEQVNDIFKMVGQLSSNVNRFEEILKGKERKIEQLNREKELLYEEIDKLRMELKQKEQTHAYSFEFGDIISSQELDDGTTAYIIQNKN